MRSFNPRVAVAFGAGDTVSAAVDISQFDEVAVEVPSLPVNTTVQIQVASVDAQGAEGTYRTLQKDDQSGPWQLAAGQEDLYVRVRSLRPFRKMKLVLGAAQGGAGVTLGVCGTQ